MNNVALPPFGSLFATVGLLSLYTVLGTRVILD